MSKIITKHPKRYQKLLVASGILIFIFIVLLFTASIWIKHTIKSRLDKIEGLKYEALNISWTCNDLQIKNIYFSPTLNDSEINCKEFNITGLSRWQFLKNDQINIESVSVKDLDAKVIHSLFPYDSDEQKTKQAIYINRFNFENIKVDWQDKAGSIFESDNINGSVSKISFTSEDSIPIVQFKNLAIQTSTGTYKKAEGHYSLNWNSLNIDPQQNTLLVNDLELKPLHTKEGWSSYFDYKKARLQLKTPSVQMDGFNPKVLFDKNVLYADSIIVSAFDLSVLVDESGVPCPDCYKPFIHEKLYQADLPIIISKALIKNGNLNIEVLGSATEKIGVISFQNIYASIYDINNTVRDSNHKIHADVQTDFMGERSLTVAFDFFMTAPSFDYAYEASIDQLDLKQMNRFAIPTKNARIQSGFLNSLHFKVNGNSKEASGTMQFEYEDLKITLIDKKDKTVRKVLTKIVNSIGIKNNNIAESAKYAEGKMYYPRARNRSIFHQWSNTVQSGFKSIMLPDIVLNKKLK